MEQISRGARIEWEPKVPILEKDQLIGNSDQDLLYPTTRDRDILFQDREIQRDHQRQNLYSDLNLLYPWADGGKVNRESKRSRLDGRRISSISRYGLACMCCRNRPAGFSKGITSAGSTFTDLASRQVVNTLFNSLHPFLSILSPSPLSSRP